LYRRERGAAAELREENEKKRRHDEGERAMEGLVAQRARPLAVVGPHHHLDVQMATQYIIGGSLHGHGPLRLRRVSAVCVANTPDYPVASNYCR
jgi:hypothetical protein